MVNYKVGSANWLKKLIHKITVFIKQLVDLLFPILLLCTIVVVIMIIRNISYC